MVARPVKREGVAPVPRADHEAQAGHHDRRQQRDEQEEQRWLCTAQLHQLLLWQLVWGEAANLRFMPEMLYFFFECARAWEQRDVGETEASARPLKRKAAHSPPGTPQASRRSVRPRAPKVMD